MENFREKLIEKAINLLDSDDVYELEKSELYLGCYFIQRYGDEFVVWSLEQSEIKEFFK
jgi:hypothetical protein